MLVLPILPIIISYIRTKISPKKYLHFAEKKRSIYRPLFLGTIIQSFQNSNHEAFNFVERSGRKQHLSVQEYKKAKNDAQERSESILTRSKEVAEDFLVKARKEALKEKIKYASTSMPSSFYLNDEIER